MKFIITLFLFLSFCYSLFSQKAIIDFNEIKDISSTENYGNLLNRYIENDTTLSVDDYVILYYGQAYRDNFKPNSTHDSIKVLRNYVQSTDGEFNFEKILYYSNIIVTDNPFDLERIYYIAICCSKLGFEEDAYLWYFKYKNLLKAILSSGNGKDYDNAIYVVKISDEYTVLNALEFEFVGQSLQKNKGKYYDVMQIKDNPYDIDAVYFDINLFFGKF